MSPSRIASVLSVSGLTVLATATLTAAPAAAQEPATVRVDTDAQSIAYLAADGQENDLYVTSMGTGDGVRYVGFNDVVPIQAGDGCEYADPGDDTMVICALPTDSELPDDILIYLGDGDDHVFTSDPGVSLVHGGPGNDELHAHSAAMVMGDEGDDLVMGALGLMGGDGDDHLIGDPGDQVMRGGRGNDVIEGMDGDDVIYGNSGDDYITGGRGNDYISGGPGDDIIYGNSGDDTILGGGGNDTISGGPGNDSISPGPGNNDVRQ
ncbi:calcium-binding protein [Streptomyces sp. 7-21]|jgi:Ca2+-binding RTX toxin-like protein|uniref:calcium-binding protein n=1 Tax=Streptomyces sp. 7-21 TaxID=2802283 RepID=UPI00191E38FB|nr:calcium-binding protein [Streptomyces sp. 7-21]MBL1065562.1 calcium-binding protein [Streptomyces sp. 7-21]